MSDRALCCLAGWQLSLFLSMSPMTGRYETWRDVVRDADATVTNLAVSRLDCMRKMRWFYSLVVIFVVLPPLFLHCVSVVSNCLFLSQLHLPNGNAHESPSSSIVPFFIFPPNHSPHSFALVHVLCTLSPSHLMFFCLPSSVSSWCWEPVERLTCDQ